tara:strand:- start:1893 stop:2381 length:489 start_codon:yes stop_codon:yes gene_type:complete
MDKFNLKEYIANNPLLKENISMEDGDDVKYNKKITYYAEELIDMFVPGDEKGVEGLLQYLDDNPEEMPSSWDADFINNPNNYNNILDKVFELTPMQENKKPLKENVGGDVEIEFQNWLDEMSTIYEDEKITLQTVIDYAKDTLQDYGMDDWQPGQPLPENDK